VMKEEEVGSVNAMVTFNLGVGRVLSFALGGLNLVSSSSPLSFMATNVRAVMTLCAVVLLLTSAPTLLLVKEEVFVPPPHTTTTTTTKEVSATITHYYFYCCYYYHYQYYSYSFHDEDMVTNPSPFYHQVKPCSLLLTTWKSIIEGCMDLPLPIRQAAIVQFFNYAGWALFFYYG